MERERPQIQFSQQQPSVPAKQEALNNATIAQLQQVVMWLRYLEPTNHALTILPQYVRVGGIALIFLMSPFFQKLLKELSNNDYSEVKSDLVSKLLVQIKKKMSDRRSIAGVPFLESLFKLVYQNRALSPSGGSESSQIDRLWMEYRHRLDTIDQVSDGRLLQKLEEALSLLDLNVFQRELFQKLQQDIALKTLDQTKLPNAAFSLIDTCNRPLCCRGYFNKGERVKYDRQTFNRKHLYFQRRFNAKDYDSILVDLCSLLNAGGGILLIGVTDKGEVEGLRTYSAEVEENPKIIRTLFQKFQPEFSQYKLTHVPVRTPDNEKGLYVFRIVVSPPPRHHILYYWVDKEERVYLYREQLEGQKLHRLMIERNKPSYRPDVCDPHPNLQCQQREAGQPLYRSNEKPTKAVEGRQERIPPRKPQHALENSNIFLLLYVSAEEIDILKQFLKGANQEHVIKTPDNDRFLHIIYIDKKLAELKQIVKNLYMYREGNPHQPFLVMVCTRLRIKVDNTTDKAAALQHAFGILSAMKLQQPQHYTLHKQMIKFKNTALALQAYLGLFRNGVQSIFVKYEE